MASPTAAELLGCLGFDWLVIDQQHSPVGSGDLPHLIRAVRAAGAAPIVRVGRNQSPFFDAALDLGAEGVMVPQVMNARQASNAVSLAYHPPNGRRSIGGIRKHLGPIVSDDRPFVIVQIEHIRAVEQAYSIVHTPGIGACFVGPQDLAASMGLPPVVELSHRDLRKAIRAVSKAARECGVPAGIFVPTADAVSSVVDDGFRLIAVSTDAQLLASAAAAIPRLVRNVQQ